MAEVTGFDTAITVASEAAAAKVAAELVARSARFAVLPMPDDEWAVYVLRDSLAFATRVAIDAADDEPRRAAIVRMALDRGYYADESCEFDESARVSEGDDNGAYVQCWTWVDFNGTEFDKDGGGNDGK